MADPESEIVCDREGLKPLNVEIGDDEIFVMCFNYPGGVRDFVLHQRTNNRCFRVLNPLELLGTNSAVQILEYLGRQSAEHALQFSLSRLLVQCLEYSRNTRHLIVEEWTDEDLRGEHLFEGNRTELARDCSAVQADRYRLVMSGADTPEVPAEDQYWGTFSTLPQVADMFDDAELGRLAIQLMRKIEGDGDENKSVEIAWLRSFIKRCWKSQFSEFQLQIGKRGRRPLFKKLMSVAVRQASTLTQRIAYAFTVKSLGLSARSAFQLSDREERLFEIRYGSYKPLGNINIGFLFGDGDLHTDLLNSLGRSLVSNEPEEVYLNAEEELYRHVKLLGELRENRKTVRAEQKFSTRGNNPRRLPAARTQAQGQEDVISPKPEANIMAAEELARLARVLPLLKERDRKRVEAVIAANGDKREAAAILDVAPDVFIRRYKQATRKNVKAAWKKLMQSEDQ